MPKPKKKSSVGLVADRDFLPITLALMRGATNTVDVLAYSFAIGSAAGKLAQTSAPMKIASLLAELAEGGVKVRVYLEHERDTAERNLVTADWLRKRGVEIKLGATHAKGIAVDGRALLFGSTNLTNQSVAKNHEANVLMADPSAAQVFGKYFTHYWKGGRHGGVKLPLPFLPDGAFLPALLAAIGGARHTIAFSIYFFQQREVERALLEARARGVRVTGLVHRHFAFALPYVRRTRGTVERLLAGGITDLHYGPSSLFTHSKFLVADSKLTLIGTGNWLDEDVETHPQLYVALPDPALAKKLEAHLARLIERVGEAA